jgi:hypothetical protein
MLSPGFGALYVVSAVLFLLPWSLLFGSWLSFNRAEVAAPLPTWRRSLVYAALFVASASTVLNMVWNASWLHNGGSPHGRGRGRDFGSTSDRFSFGLLRRLLSWASSERESPEP